MKNEKNYEVFFYYRNIADCEAFWWDKNFSKNLLFLGSVMLSIILGPNKTNSPKIADFVPISIFIFWCNVENVVMEKICQF